jgi:hypothetical protein
MRSCRELCCYLDFVCHIVVHVCTLAVMSGVNRSASALGSCVSLGLTLWLSVGNCQTISCGCRGNGRGRRLGSRGSCESPGEFAIDLTDDI